MEKMEKPLKILVINEMSLFKNWMLKGSKGTLGGIETNHKNLMRGFWKKGFTILENKAYPAGDAPDIIICPTYGPVSLLMIWWYKRKYNSACVQHAHTTLDDLKGGFLPDSFVPFMGFFLKILYRFSEILITPSNFSKNNLLSLGIPTKPPIEPVSNGVKLHMFHPDPEKGASFKAYLRDTHGIDTTKPIILCVGVIWERKGVDVFHAVAKSYPEYEFIWVGNYITAKKTKERYDDLDNLTFTGFVDDIVGAYCGSDVFFFPSRAENQGIPLLEAAACKLPILCRNLPTYNWIEDGVHCLKASTTKQFKVLLKQLVNDGKTRETLVENAFENVKEHEMGKIVNKVENIYRRAIRLRKKVLELEKGGKGKERKGGRSERDGRDGKD
ncbi:MAG: glycosyltransferase family 4 protein [Promethearchaeota archaeon]